MPQFTRLIKVLALGLPGLLAAQTAGQYTFTGAGSFGRTNPFSYNGVVLHSVTASSLARSAGLNAYGWSNMYLAENWPIGASDSPGLFNTPAQLTGSIDLTKYFEFTLTAATGKTFSNPSVYFNLRRFDKGPQQWSWRSSLDNYVSDLPLSVVGGTPSTVSHSAGVITLADVTTVSGFELKVDAQNLSTITFRLYGYNAESAVGADGGRAGFETKFNFSVDNTYDAGGWSLGSRPAAGEYIYLADNFNVAPDSAYDVLGVEVAPSKTLTIEADANGYGQLKTGTWRSGSVVQNMYLTGSGHHALASPMTDGFTTTSGTASALYSYDAATGAYNMSPSTTAAGTGYFGLLGTGGFRTANGTFSVTGTPNTAHTHSLGYATTVAAGGSGNGWNLVGNPYTCALDWTAVTKSAGVTNAFYIWDPLTSTYDYYVSGVSAPTSYVGSSIASPYIAPMQAFWVQTTSSGQTLTSTMAASGTVAQAPRLYKTGLDQVILVATSVVDSTKADALWIKNVDGATSGFEAAEDAWKMGNYGGQPELATWFAGDRLAVNAIDLSGPTSVPVDFRAPENGVKYSFRVEADGYEAVLEDRLTGVLHPLSQGPAVLRSEAWTEEVPRLVLHINPNALGLAADVAPEFWAFATTDAVLVHAATAGWAELLSLDGRVLDRQRVEPGVTALRRPQVSGVYLVRSASQTAKIWVP